MSKKQDVALPVIRRLPRYYRFLSYQLEEGRERISSAELSRKMGLTASQIRQDFNCFGGFGQQGYGYNIALLREKIGDILGLNKKINTILVGVGNMGRAIANKMNFESEGFNLSAIFDSNPDAFGKKYQGVEVLDFKTVEEYCQNNDVKAAIVCVPDSAAREVVETLINSGIKVFWNFTHFDILMEYKDNDIVVENVHMNDSLMILRYLSKDI
ncbi:MAG: redox-sensing transcriptional repressor Rex [Oscillospiraceae bacterium]|nr:redox-sensing transcriptional repressor Rex [Oscillospiraceae bacterium]